jgi:peptide/nickel transport system substrate-binding protein
MKRRSTVAATAVGAFAALVISACSSSSGTSNTGTGSGSGNTGAAAYNAGVSQVVNPSTHKGGTLTFDSHASPDSFDPGNTYYAWVLNFTRLYAMPMFTYQSCPGKCGLNLVPDLATDMGTTSSDGKTWTFHIKSNVKYENGQVVTAADVKYAIERQYDRSVMSNGPTYYQALLTDPTYPGPYKDRAKNLMGLTAIDVPNATTLVFHLQSPFPDLPYVLGFPNSAPVPASADKGSNYQLHPLSTGPYKFQSYTLNKQLTLVPNPEWDPATDPQAMQLASQIIVNLNVTQADIDNRLLSGDIDVDAAGVGVGPAAQSKILTNPTYKANADNPLNGFGRFVYIDTKVAPFTNLHCREAVEYAANKQSLQNAWGGPVVGGEIASTVNVPTVVGYQRFDLYEAVSKPAGDITAAKQQLTQCGQPNGFTTTMAYRNDNPQETAAATALQASLAQVGIKLTLQGFPGGSYYTNFAGAPAYMHSHNIGLAAGGWGADWPTGYGFLDALANGNAIPSSGNANIEELNDPTINNLFAKSSTLSGGARNAIFDQIDHQIMAQAGILPEVYQKSLLYRPPNLTNVYVQTYYGMYNYAVLGVKS